jgi:hypothetical protein
LYISISAKEKKQIALPEAAKVLAGQRRSNLPTAEGGLGNVTALLGRAFEAVSWYYHHLMLVAFRRWITSLIKTIIPGGSVQSMTKCSQCDRQAVGHLADGRGPAVCLEHWSMFVNTVAKQDAMLADQIEELEAHIQMVTGIPLPRRQRPSSIIHKGNIMNHVKIDNSTIGILNTGTVKNINATISYFQHGDPQHAQELKAFAEAVDQSQDLAQQNKKEVLDQLAYVTEEIRKRPEERNTSVAKAALKGIGDIVRTASSLLTLWEKLGPWLGQLLQ